MYTFSFSGNTKETVSSDVKVLKKGPGDKRINVMNSTEIGKCTTIQELCCFESLKQPHRTIISTLNVFSFHHFFNGECTDFCCSSKGYFPSSSIKTSVRLPGNHWSLWGPNFTASVCDLYFGTTTLQTLLLF